MLKNVNAKFCPVLKYIHTKKVEDKVIEGVINVEEKTVTKDEFDKVMAE